MSCTDADGGGIDVPSSDPDFDPDRPAVIKAGTYQVVLVNYRPGYYFGKVPKLILTFRIVTEGPYYGMHLKRCYNIKGFTKRKGVIPKGWASDFVRDYGKLFGLPRRLRDISITKFENKIFECSVRTVTHDRKQKPLPEQLQYSVIDELLRVIVGDK